MSAASPGPLSPANTLAELASWLWEREPSCGPVRLVGIDGHAGSGKSTLSSRLSSLMSDAPVLHLDDVSRHDELFSWTRRLRSQVLEPLSRGETAQYEVYDWTNRAATRVRELAPEPMVLLEGVGAGRRALRPYLSAVLWVDLDRDEAWERGLHRDGAELADFWQVWMKAEHEHFEADPTLPFASWIIRQSSESSDGFTAFPGPEPSTAEPPRR